MEFLLIPLMIILGLILGVGITYGARHAIRSTRQQRWAELTARFNHVLEDSSRHELDPSRALATPAWLNRAHPLVRGFTSSLNRAKQERTNLEIMAAGRFGNQLFPTQEQLHQYELLVEQVEDSYVETDRAVRIVGELSAESSEVPHHQFLLDPRWGRPSQYPQLGALTEGDAVAVVKKFLDGSFPVHKKAAQNALRKHTRTYKDYTVAKKAFDHLFTSHRYITDPLGMIWPASVDPHNWGVHRLFGTQSEIGLAEVPAAEIANAAWLLLPENTTMTEEQLQEALIEKLALNTTVASQLGRMLHDGLSKSLESIGAGLLLPGNKPAQAQLLYQGIQEGLLTGRLQRTADGGLRRLRTEWPVSYRR